METEDEIQKKIEAERLKEHADVKEALEQTSLRKRPVVTSAGEKVQLFATLLAVVALLGLDGLASLGLLGVPVRFVPRVQRLALGGAGVAAMLAVAQTIQIFVVNRIENAASR